MRRVTGSLLFRLRGVLATSALAISTVVSAQSIEQDLDRAAQLQAAGQLDAAAEVLEALHSRATSPADRAVVHLALANQYTLTHKWNDAQLALKVADGAASDDSRFVAELESVRGNLLVARNRDGAATAIEPLTRAAMAATRAGDPMLVAQTATNLARAARAADDAAAAQRWNEANVAVARLGESAEKANLQISLAVISADRRAAHELLSSAYATGQKLKQPRIESNALGRLAAVYRANRQYDEALQCSRRAAFAAQQMPDLLYRWNWQTARTLSAKGDRDGAIAAYRQAADALAPIRATVSIGWGNQIAPADPGTSPFRAAAGDLYLELADLLLRRAAANGDAAADLLAARDALEDLKAAELEDYFQTDCATLVRADLAEIEKLIEPTTAVVYVVPLQDRTELLLGMNHGGKPTIRRFASAATRADLFAAGSPGNDAGCVVQFRRHLEDRTSHEYRLSGRKVYDAIIAPLETTLREYQIDTLVFVPDDALRTIPMAALWDGNDFLIARYATATVPGLRLMRGGEVKSKPTVLAVGSTQRIDLSEDGSTVVYPALQYVDDELSSLRNRFGARQIIDAQATEKKLAEELDGGRFGIVHLAMHGEFKDESAETFLLLGSPDQPEKLTLDALNLLILPNQFRGAPVQLLTLSACRSAAGDDRAALGLGGVALKAGARSALATLWFVNDKVSAQLTDEFYANVSPSAGGAGLAKALQRAQLKIARSEADRRFRHPCYWSPYLLIGSWR